VHGDVPLDMHRNLFLVGNLAFLLGRKQAC
jgi:hypothetical protein